MAHLPPKAPSMAANSNWPDFSSLHQRIRSMESSPANNNNHPSWVDEVFDFSSSKRGSHRRSVSDSVAFLEVPLIMEASAAAVADCSRRSSTAGSGSNTSDFERFDDDQLMYMFNDDVVPMCVGPSMSNSSNPSSPSDHNSFNDDNNNNNNNNNNKQVMTVVANLQKEQMMVKSEPEEVQSPMDVEHPREHSHHDNSNDRIVDPKRIKRILANRQSAQRSRVRKLQYISELERSVTSLQAEVSVLSPRVAFLDHQRMVLTVDNGVLKQRIAALAQNKIFKDAHQEALKREIERLRQIYYQQNMKNMENNNNNNNNSTTPSSTVDTNALAEKEQLVN